MMTPRRKLTFIGLIFLLTLILLLLILWRLWPQTPAAPPPSTPVVPTQNTSSRANAAPAAPASVPAPTETQVSLQSLAQTFTTRYGSYSNESDFANLLDVQGLMSASFAAATQKTIDAGMTPSGYYGISTQVLKVTVDAMDDTAGTAQASVTTQREEAKGTPQNQTVVYQTLVLTFVKENGTWKVDSASWK